jgi:hypothetical protein
MQGEAAHLEEAAPQPPFNIPSPVCDTDSDEDDPPSAQDPYAQPCGNSDNAEAATTSIPTVQAQMIQTAGPHDSATNIHPFC